MANEQNSLRVSIDASGAQNGATQFKIAAQSIKGDAAGIDASLRQLDRAPKEFRFASGGQFTEQLKSRMELQQDMEDRLFAATHTNLETSLRAHDEYFSSLRIGYQNNESMLTLITKTEAAERQKIIENAATQGNSRMLSMLRSVFRVGMYAYVANSLIDMATAMHKAQRTGENMFGAMLSSLPIINRFADSFKKAANEISGYAAAQERAEKVKKIKEGVSDIEQQTTDSMRILSLPPAQRQSEEYRIEYEKQTEKINDAIKRRNELYKAIEPLQAQLELAPAKAQKTFAGPGAGMGLPGEVTKSYYEQQIKQIKEQISALDTLEKTASDAAQVLKQQLLNINFDPLNEMNDKLKEQVETFGLSNEQMAIRRARLSGLTEAEIAQAAAIGKSNDEYSVQLKILEQQKDIIENAKSPGQKFSELSKIVNDMIAAKKLTPQAGADYLAKERNKIYADELDLAKKRSEITSQMYQDMQNYGDGYYQAQKNLLELQKKDYEKFRIDQNLIDQWYNNQLLKLKIESTPALQELKGIIADTQGALQELYKGGDFSDFKQQILDSIQNSLTKMLSQATMFAITAPFMEPETQGAMGIINPYAGLFGGEQNTEGAAALTMAGTSLTQSGTVLNAGSLNLSTAAFQLQAAAMALQTAAATSGGGGAGGGMGFASMFGSGGGAGAGDTGAIFSPSGAGDLNPGMANMAHTGGTFSRTSFPQRPDHAFLWNDAPRLHRGNLRPDEYRAILRKEETVRTPQQENDVQSKLREKSSQNSNLNIRTKTIIVFDRDELAKEIMNTPTGEEISVIHYRNNRERL